MWRVTRGKREQGWPLSLQTSPLFCGLLIPATYGKIVQQNLIKPLLIKPQQRIQRKMLWQKKILINFSIDQSKKIKLKRIHLIYGVCIVHHVILQP